MSLKLSRRGLLVGMGATAVDAVLPVQANTRDDPMAYCAAGELVEASSRELVDSAIARIEALEFEDQPELPVKYQNCEVDLRHSAALSRFPDRSCT
jgi:hypothetical protein